MRMENSHLERSNCYEDRLSTLPDELLLKILNKTVSYKEAVKCSVLSKRWRYLYTRLSELHFRESEMINDIPIGLDRKQRKKRRRNLISKFVSPALFHHKGVVDTFSLMVWDNMSLWHWCLDFITNYPIKELHLMSFGYSILDEFPFSCENLLILNLCNIQCDSVVNKLEFPNLKICILRFQSYDSLWLERFLSKCPALYYLEFNATFTSQLSPFTFPTGSLRSLELCLSAGEGAVEIRVQAPRLLKMSVYCRKFESNLTLKVEAPSLLKLSLDFSLFRRILTLKVEAPALQELAGKYHEKWGSHIQCSQAVWKDNVYLQVLHKAKWSAAKQLMLLDMESDEVAGELNLEDISKYVALKVLKLSFFKIYPVNFWEILPHLPLLESLTLSHCTFEDHDEFNIPMEEDVDLEVSNAVETGDLIYTKKCCRESELTEISITLESRDRGKELEREEREMIQLFWVKAIKLRKLVVTIYMEEHLSKTKYLKFFQHLMSTGDKVHITENARHITFQLIKKTQERLLSNS